MNITLRTIAFLALSILFSANMQAKSIYDSDIKEEQRIATFTISSANNDLEQASVAYSRNMNNLAWVYITDCGVKLDGIKIKLKGHEERIAKAVNFLGFGLSKSSRQRLMDSYFRIKDNITSAYVKMNAVEKDVGAKLGVDVSWVRQMLSALKAACESTNDPAFCEAYEKAKAAIEAGNIAEVNSILMGIYSKLDSVKGSSPDIVVPAQKQTSSASPAQINEINRMIALLQKACDNGNEAACEALRKLQQKMSANDTAGAAALIAQMKNDPAIATILNGGTSSGGYTSADSSSFSSGTKIIPVDGEDLTFINGTAIKTVFAGTRLKSESVLKLTTPDAQPPYEVVSTRNWSFSISSTDKESSATVYVVEFTLVEQQGRDEYNVNGWTVLDSNGQVIANGATVPFEVKFTASGTYSVEISGETDMGSEFTIKSSIQISL